MKKCYPLLHAIYFAISLAFTSCTLDKEPDIPVGANNIEKPDFQTVEVNSTPNNSFLAKAWLGDPGNLNIWKHGWVWSDTPNPTLEHDSLVLDTLTANMFENEITGLDPGKLYYFRSFVITPVDTLYSPEPGECGFIGADFTINTDTVIFRGADVQFTNTTPCDDCTYGWNFGDGSSGSGSSALHTFNIKGKFTVQLYAYKTKDGCTATATKTMSLEVIDDPFEGYWADIPGGDFIMGCTSEQDTCFSVYDPANGIEAVNLPAHPVNVKSFFMGKTEVTQRQWVAVMNDNPSFWIQCGLDCPVEAVSWNNIVNEFIPALYRKTGRYYRLPTEAEWEYAARGDTITKYSGADSIDLVAWYWIQGVTTSPDTVAQKLPNKFGLFDMTGNMWEWVEDDYHVDYEGAPTDGSAWIDTPRGEKRMARGGGWGSGKIRCLVSFRNEGTTGDRSDSWGFRLARSK